MMYCHVCGELFEGQLAELKLPSGKSILSCDTCAPRVPQVSSSILCRQEPDVCCQECAEGPVASYEQLIEQGRDYATTALAVLLALLAVGLMVWG